MNASILVALLGIKGIGPKKAGLLLKSLSQVQLADLSLAIESKLSAGLDPRDWRLLCAYGEETVAKALDHGLSVVDILSAEYPGGLKRLDDPPLVVFVKGQPTAMRTQYPLAIVGSRSPCAYTKKAGAAMSGLAASKASSIISGLAVGCDSIAHSQALLNGTPTVAVVAHGLDIVYPSVNKSLAIDIVESGGCLVSEYPIGAPPRPNHFIARDRIQAGLSMSGILLQSSKNGGSMHAMRALLKINARVGVLVPPHSSSRTEEWGGTLELMGLSETICLDPESKDMPLGLDALVAEGLVEKSEEREIQASLF